MGDRLAAEQRTADLQSRMELAMRFLQTSDSTFQPPFKIANVHLVNALCISPDKLYREFEEVLRSVDRFKNGRIYFVVRRKKVRFKSVKINGSCTLIFKFSYAGFLSPAYKIPMSVFLHGSTDVNKAYFPTPRHLQPFMHLVKSESDYQSLLRKNPNTVGIMPAVGDIDRSDRAFTFNLLLPIDQVPSQQNRHTVFAHQLLRILDIDEGSYEIRYIGKAMDLKDRTDGHSQIQQSQNECQNDEEIFLYFFTPIFNALASLDGAYIYKPSDLNRLEEEKLVLIAEAGLINYFAPELNKHHKKSDITKSKTILPLKLLKYTHLGVECIFDEYDFAFETESVAKSNHHKKIFDLN
ncbi:hypothetical protein ALP06_03441 [Pseudomonas coronafaciens pv. atropurpurea]|nr:hypothetical protein ALP06_03441 [Pseudomonas coronafaciens pv. atropurpurea]